MSLRLSGLPSLHIPRITTFVHKIPWIYACSLSTFYTLRPCWEVVVKIFASASCNPILGRRTKSLSRLQGLTFSCVWPLKMLDKIYVICSWGKTQFHTGLFSISGRQRASSADLCKRFPIFLGKLHHITHTRAPLLWAAQRLSKPPSEWKHYPLQLLCITCNVVYSPDLYGLN